MFRKMIAGIKMRFMDTDDLLATMNLLDRGLKADASNVVAADHRFARLVIAGELIRRGIIFWD